MEEVIDTTYIYDFLIEKDQLSNSKKLFALEGSSGAGKTWGVIDFILDWCRIHNYEDKRITIGRETYKDCIDTVAFDFFKRLKQIGWYSDDYHKKSHPQSYFLFGNQIDFTGWANNGQPSKRQDILWFNEILESYEEEFKQYNQRTNDITIFDWNPKVTEHWVYNTLLDRPDCNYIHCKMLNNPYLPDGQKNEILAYEPTAINIKNGTADDFMWKVYGLGIRTAPKGVIFQNVTWIDSFPEGIKYGYGNDFGFTNDPNALVKVGISSQGIFAELLCYEPIDNAHALSDMFIGLGISRADTIIADSADKYNDVEMVQDLHDLGWRHVEKADKGKGLLWSIGQVKKNKIHIVRNVNAKREQENYKWREVNGILVNEPIDKYNHFWDALRYGYHGLSEPDFYIKRRN